MSSVEPVDLTVSRTFLAPPAAVYAAWTEPELVRRWWGPSGFTCPVAEMDVREGGVSLVCMQAPAEWGGVKFFNTWTYGAVEPQRRLEFVLRFSDERRSMVTPRSLGLPPGVPPEVHHVLTFAEQPEGGCLFTIVERGYTSAEAVETSKAGLVQTLDKLALVVES